MGQGGDVLNGRDSHPGALEGGDGRLSPGAGALDADLKFDHAEFFGGIGTFFRGPLSGKRGAFS